MEDDKGVSITLPKLLLTVLSIVVFVPALVMLPDPIVRGGLGLLLVGGIWSIWLE